MAEQNNSAGIDWIVLVVLLLALGAGLWLGFELGKHRTRISAVRAGVGEFYISDKEAPQGSFRWVTTTNSVNR